jgi:hypothetical protein
MAAVLGSAGNTIVEDLSFETISEFIFKDMDPGEASLAWQPSSIPTQLQKLILADSV